MAVPFFQHATHDASWHHKLHETIRQTIEHGQFILGPEVSAFEKEFAQFCETRECVGVGNGCEALHLLLQALGIKAGDEIIVPANTFIGTILPILRIGAIPVFVDCSREHFNIEVRLIRAAITARTKAIVPVHLYGRPAPMEEILSLANEFHLQVVEDAAQAQGMTYRGHKAGNLAPHASFSFYPSKNLGAMGDAGAVVTSDPQIAERIRGLRNYGQRVKYHHDYEGWNSRLDSIQAAILSHKLKVLEGENAARRRHAQEYQAGLAGLPLVLPVDAPDTQPVYHLFVILTEHRDALAAYLKQQGIDTGIHYPIPCPRQKVILDKLGATADCPEADWQAQRLLSLPMFPDLKSAQIDEVCTRIKEFYNTRY